MTVTSFVDSNVAIYAHDAAAGRKQEIARDLLLDLWRTGDGCLSIQVLQEFFVNVTRKLREPMEPAMAAKIVYLLSRWQMHVPAASDVLGAIDIHIETGISFWDAMIVRSASQLQCDVIWSEDLNPGQIYGGVRVQNPFDD